MDNISSFQLEWITFEPVYEEKFILVSLHMFTIFNTLIIIPSCYGIIWFERDNHLRTLINQGSNIIKHSKIVAFTNLQP